MEEVDITIEGADPDFNAARKSSDEIAERRLKEPLLVAWYDGAAETGHPDVHECHDKPGWKTYAESRGGQLTVNVNAGRYILIYSETSLDDT